MVQDHDKQKATYEILKSNVSLLSDAAAAQETFKKFENASATVERYVMIRSHKVLTTKSVTTIAPFFFFKSSS